MNISIAQQQREKTKAKSKKAKQSVLVDPYFSLGTSKSNKADKPKKEIIIQDIAIISKEHEVALIIAFKLLPNKASFSKVILDLYFEQQLLNSTLLNIPQGALTTDSFEFPHLLYMKGIAQGRYSIRIEMYEPWSSGEKLNYTFKELAILYVPKTPSLRYVKVPTVKSVAGSDLVIVSSSAKTLYHDIEEDKKRQSISSRDKW